jgi:hypothetical protein
MPILGGSKPMARHVIVLGLAALLVLSARAEAGEWKLQPADGDHGAILTMETGTALSFRFACTADAVFVTETGVTRMIDLKTRKPIGDDAQAVMPPGAAMIGVLAEKAGPQFVPAVAVKNPAGGWDLTIRLAKSDKHLKAIGKSTVMSLFTTGYTMAVQMDDTARAQWNDFMQRCATGG